MDTRDAPRDPAAWAAELCETAADYERFADRIGPELAPAYRDLAEELRHRAERLLNPDTACHEPPADAPPETPAAPLSPQSPEQLLAAWRPLLAALTARRSGLDADGAELLEGADRDPQNVPRVGALAILLNSMDPKTAQAIVENWALKVAGASDG